MEIVKIISEHKRKLKNKPPKRGYKRVMAVVRQDERSFLETRHLDIKE